jgi:mRNA m6A methyltransferase catalytic subunit
VYPNVNQRGAVSLPSGLGAGGRGKEKAPCRYLHFEVDWDGDEGAGMSAAGEGGVNGFVGGAGMGVGKLKDKEIVKPRKPYQLGIGLGPDGKNMKVVSCLSRL